MGRSWSRCGPVLEQMWAGSGADVGRYQSAIDTTPLYVVPRTAAGTAPPAEHSLCATPKAQVL